MDHERRQALEAYSHEETTALELRRRLGGATCGEELMRLGEADPPLPGADSRSRIVEISALAFLTVLKAERRVQSADEVFERAKQAGRSAFQAETLGRHDEPTRRTLRDLARRSDRE